MDFYHRVSFWSVISLYNSDRDRFRLPPSVTDTPLCSAYFPSCHSLTGNLQEEMDTFMFLQVPQFLSMLVLTEVKVIRPGQAVIGAAEL